MSLQRLALAWLHPELGRLPAPPFALGDARLRTPGLLQAWNGAALRALTSERETRPGELVLWPLGSGEEVASALRRVRAEGRGSAFAPIPYFTGEDAGGERSTRLLQLYRGLLPGDSYPKRVRDDLRELVRRLHPSRALLFRALEHFALAGIELGAPPLALDPAPESAPTRAAIVAIEGIDGAGKSSHLAALGEHLAALGRRVERLKIFRHGVFHRTVTDLVRACHGERELHLWRLERLFKLGDSLKYFHAAVEPALGRADVLLFDRYVSTHVAAATGRLFDDAGARELLAVYPRAERVYLLDLPVEEALARLGTRGERTIDENRFMLERYRRRLLVQARQEGFVVLDARRPFAVNQTEMRADLARFLAGRRA